jgi:USP6 N-terminal-like protein
VTLSLSHFISQYKLQQNFGYSDNYVIQSLEKNMLDLRAKRMHLPAPAGENELPKLEMGQFVEPTIEKKLGLRSGFTDSERNVTEFVISRNEENGNDLDPSDDNQCDDTISNLNTGK